MERHILCNVQDECGLTHGRTRRNQNQIRWLQARCTVIQIDKTGGNSGYGSRLLGSLLNLLQGIHDHLTDWNKIPTIPAGEKRKHVMLCLIHNAL